MSYEPRGRMIDLMAALKAEPERIFRATEVAEILRCKNFPSTIEQYLYAASGSGLVYKRKVGADWYYAGVAVSDLLLTKAGVEVAPANGVGRLMPSPNYTPAEVEAARADVRAPKVDPAWTPPKMVSPRAQSEPARAPLPEPMHRIIAPPLPPVIDKSEEELGRAIVAQNQRVNTMLADRIAKVCTPAPTQAPEPEVEQELEGEAESEALDFNAALWADGDLMLYGLVELEGGGHRLDAEHVPALKRLLAGVAG
jgi:hypothetical protein